MHDINGTPLAEGDNVLIPAKIKKLHGGEEFCNVDLETTVGRRPDGEKEMICAVNTGCMVKVSSADVKLEL